MKPWTKKKSLVRGVRFVTELEPVEREMLGNSAANVGELLIGRARSAPKDELAEMTGLPSGHTDAPDDPVLAAMLPSFFRDGDEEVDGEAGVSRQFNETDIIKGKLTNLRLVSELLGPDGSVNVSLNTEQTGPWLNALTDIRAFHNGQIELIRKRLDEFGETGGQAGADEIAAAENYVEWLGYHQDSLLTALMGPMDVPEE
ncbi:MAG: DUF2017 domain-containing protein [Corynebacterium sp.]|uniref:DUF2017 domain-containing protein n=1 Tax=unclassified Corynebacterium TaxID=2624378 RepID=UPI002649E349|nr:DUF2017 domain-containing protein [Corynebacterium sp.]MDN5582039.1 DUF2017 domain-containing protein [Corynebacterium sp.]MDN5719398.1 DUF2017 domain-containing protein [Corynebacterium sp.]MDN6324115.1 DUF2017 domain-containing protein [Corynebacterium sp.]MDN6509391.1 DUF2017 domain-containing protein [Corynebacterium sp.]